MEWNVIYELINPTLIIVVGFCWVIGYMLKQTPLVPDWLIVYIVTLASVVMAVFMIGFSAESIIHGVLCGAFAVYGHQVIKQSKEREKQ